MLDQYNNKKKPFDVPEDYFANLNNRIMSKIDEQIQVEATKKKPKKLYLWVGTVAACAVILAMALTFNPSPGNGSFDDEYFELANGNLDDEYFMFLEEELLAESFEEIYFEENN